MLRNRLRLSVRCMREDLLNEVLSLNAQEFVALKYRMPISTHPQ